MITGTVHRKAVPKGSCHRQALTMCVGEQTGAALPPRSPPGGLEEVVPFINETVLPAISRAGPSGISRVRRGRGTRSTTASQSPPPSPAAPPTPTLPAPHLPGVVQALGLDVVSLLVHHLHFGMQVAAQVLGKQGIGKGD